jgi:hypothetical protein
MMELMIATTEQARDEDCKMIRKCRVIHIVGESRRLCTMFCIGSSDIQVIVNLSRDIHGSARLKS